MIKSSRSSTVSRRGVLFMGGVTLSGAAVALLAERPALAANMRVGSRRRKMPR